MKAIKHDDINGKTYNNRLNKKIKIDLDPNNMFNKEDNDDNIRTHPRIKLILCQTHDRSIASTHNIRMCSTNEVPFYQHKVYWVTKSGSCAY